MGLQVICAWCRKEMQGETSQDETSENRISHSLCDSCRDRFFKVDTQNTLDDLLNILEAPVLVVDEQGDIVTGNKKALQMLNKSLDEVKGFKGGDVMECAHAALPGGCGNTIHCAACTIRNNVMHTFETGISKINKQAYLNKRRTDGVEKIRFIISTEKVSDFVLLRIDDVLM
jgi:PAS domain-containing protein